MHADRIPFRDLETIFLDAGNTIASMDFSFVREELRRFNILCDVRDLYRAEAAARPAVSAELEVLKSTEGHSAFDFYMRSILRRLAATSSLGDDEHDEIIRALIPVFRAPGQNLRLWSHLLPGVDEALDILQKKNLQLVVVSNSEGIVEEVLVRLGLRHYFDNVVDSHIVGFEKPDPRLFFHALEISGAIPEKTLHIGDLYHVDVLGAWSAGLHAILIDPFDDWEDVDCMRIPNLLSFAKKIEDLSGR